MAYMAKEASQATPHCMATTPRVFREESSSRRMVATAATQGVYSLSLIHIFTGEEPLVLPARELQWRPMEASRQWENRRLAALYRLGSSPVVVTTPEALVQRCIPPRVLERTVLTLAVGQRWDLGDLARRLAGAGYTRCDQVEGPGPVSYTHLGPAGAGDEAPDLYEPVRRVCGRGGPVL